MNKQPCFPCELPVKHQRTRSFPSPSLGGLGFVGVASDLSIVAKERIGSRLPMSALGQWPLSANSSRSTSSSKGLFELHHPECLLEAIA